MDQTHSTYEEEPSSVLAQATIRGSSVMARNIRTYHWADTALGAIDSWSSTLLLQVNLMLASVYPATIAWGAQMVFLYNDASIPTLGPAHLDALGRPVGDVFRDAWPLLQEEHEACFLRGETSIRQNMPIPLLKDGRIEEGYYTYFLTPIYEGNTIAGIRGVHHETTRSVQALAQLEEVLDATSDGILSVSREWTVTYMNGRAEEILGPAPTILGTNLWDRFPHQLSPGSPYVSAYERAMVERVAGDFEATYPEPLNLSVHVEVRPAPGGIIVFLHDITAQRRAEDLLRKEQERERARLIELFEQAPVFIAVLGGPEHVFEMVNQSYRELLGHRELIGHRVVDCVPEVAGTGWIDLLDDVYQTGNRRVERGARLSLSRGDGQPLEDKFVDYVYQPRRAVDGSISGIIALGVETSLVEEVLRSTTDGIFLLDQQWCFLYLNPRAIELLSNGRTLAGRNIWEEFQAAPSLVYWENYHLTMEQRIPTEFEAYYPSPRGRWFHVHAYPTSQGISVFFRDITLEREEQERLRLLEQTVAAAPIGIALSTYNGPNDCPLIYVNPEFERLTGYSSQEVLGTDCRFLQGSDRGQPGGAVLQHAIERGFPNKAILRNYKKNGTRFLNEVHISHVRDEGGRVSHIIGIQHDITDQFEIREQLANQARHDALTGLANRYALLEQIEEALERAKESHRQVAIVVLDLDNFKHMNDRFGHIQADRILVQISRRIASVVGQTGIAARLGGDEFALVLTDWVDQTYLGKLMERLLYEIKKPLQLGNREILITGSVGVALFPQDTTEPSELLQMADLSMYWVKRSGKNSFRFYSPELRFNENEPLDLAVGFRRALANGEFQLYYQPRVSASSKQVVGCESLIRWNHPERGILLPAQFVRIAEDTGLINEIGQWVLEEALRQNATWRRAGFGAIQMSVNVSASQIRDPAFPASVACALDHAGLPGDSLELELTESLLIDNGDLAETSLGRLKQLGVRIAIDDFGTGYSGLHYLARFPVDTIKIDQVFTRDIAADGLSATICKSVLKLGQDLGLTTVAEGVESGEQAILLESWHCKELQGYLFGKPWPSPVSERALRRAQPN